MRLLQIWMIGLGLTALIFGRPGQNPTQPEPVDTGDVVFTGYEINRLKTFSPLGKLPRNRTNSYADDPQAAHFGQYLFFDTRFSANGQVSCATCHDPQKDWTDGKTVAVGLDKINRNTQSLWNVAYNRWYFWDGRVDTLWSQALHPIENPKEMGFNRLALAHRIAEDEDLRSAYTAIFGEPPDLSDSTRYPREGRPIPDAMDDPAHVSWSGMAEADQVVVNRIFSNVGKALEAYQRKLISKDAPFDTFVSGLTEKDPEKWKALPAEAQRGLKIFLGRGQCTMCHFGNNLTDMEFHNIGLTLNPHVPVDWGREKGIVQVQEDPFNGKSPYSDNTKRRTNQKLLYLRYDEHNIAAFKTPSLRNVAKTGPYMHDGRFDTLEEVLKFYSELRGAPPIGHREEAMMPVNLTEAETQEMLALLRSFTGKPLDPALLEKPLAPLP